MRNGGQQEIGSLNGGTIIGAMLSHSDGAWVVVVKQDGQYVSALMNALDDTEWYWGHYYMITGSKRSHDLTARTAAFRNAMRRAGYEDNER